MSTVEWLYRCLVGLYPPRFRREFGLEMRGVFAQRWKDAAQQGNDTLLRVVWSELRDTPTSLYRAYRAELREAIMEKQNQVVLPWKQAALAGLPLVLLGILAGMQLLAGLLGATLPIVQMNTGAFIGVIDIILGIIILVWLGAAWKAGWPRWSASLYGLGLVVILIALTPVIFLLAGKSSNMAMVLQMYLAGPVVLALVLFLVARHEPARALLTALPIVLLLWNIILEFTAPGARALVGVAAWLLAALAAAWIARGGTGRTSALLALGVTALTGLLFATARTYFINPKDKPYVQVGNLAELAERWLLPLMAISAVMVGPALLRVLHNAAQAAKRKWAFRLGLAGLLLELAGTLGAHLAIQLGEFRPYPWVTEAAVWLSYLGGALFALCAMLILTVKTERSRQMQANQWLAAAILFLIPVAITLPMAHGFLPGTRALPYGLTWLIGLPVGALMALAVAWALVGGWAMLWQAQAEETAHSSPAR